MQHLALDHCLIRDGYNVLPHLRLRTLDLEGVLEVNNKLLGVLPRMTGLTSLTLPAATCISPRLNQCSAAGLLLCLPHMRRLTTLHCCDVDLEALGAASVHSWQPCPLGMPQVITALGAGQLPCLVSLTLDSLAEPALARTSSVPIRGDAAAPVQGDGAGAPHGAVYTALCELTRLVQLRHLAIGAYVYMEHDSTERARTSWPGRGDLTEFGMAPLPSAPVPNSMPLRAELRLHVNDELVTSLVTHLTALTSLRFKDCWHLGPPALRSIAANLLGLESLDMEGCCRGMPACEFACLAPLTRLSSLGLARCGAAAWCLPYTYQARLTAAEQAREPACLGNHEFMLPAGTGCDSVAYDTLLDPSVYEHDRSGSVRSQDLDLEDFLGSTGSLAPRSCAGDYADFMGAVPGHHGAPVTSPPAVRYARSSVPLARGAQPVPTAAPHTRASACDLQRAAFRAELLARDWQASGGGDTAAVNSLLGAGPRGSNTGTGTGGGAPPVGRGAVLPSPRGQAGQRPGSRSVLQHSVILGVPPAGGVGAAAWSPVSSSDGSDGARAALAGRSSSQLASVLGGVRGSLPGGSRQSSAPPSPRAMVGQGAPVRAPAPSSPCARLCSSHEVGRVPPQLFLLNERSMHSTPHAPGVSPRLRSPAVEGAAAVSAPWCDEGGVLGALGWQHPELTALDVSSWPGVSWEQLTGLASSPAGQRLTHLRLAGCHSLHAPEVLALAGLPQLQCLDLSYTAPQHDHLAVVMSIPRLSEIILVNARLTWAASKALLARASAACVRVTGWADANTSSTALARGARQDHRPLPTVPSCVMQHTRTAPSTYARTSAHI